MLTLTPGPDTTVGMAASCLAQRRGMTNPTISVLEKPRLMRSKTICSQSLLCPRSVNSHQASQEARVQQSSTALRALSPLTSREEHLVSFAVIVSRYSERAVHYVPSIPFIRVFNEEHQLLWGASSELRSESVLELVTMLVNAFDLDAECIVFALVLLERLGLHLLQKLMTTFYWRYTLISVFALACKAWFDDSTWLVDLRMSLAAYGIYVPQLKHQESALLKLIDYNTLMQPNTFALYLFPMRAVRLLPEAQMLLSRTKTATRGRVNGGSRHPNR